MLFYRISRMMTTRNRTMPHSSTTRCVTLLAAPIAVHATAIAVSPAAAENLGHDSGQPSANSPEFPDSSRK